MAMAETEIRRIGFTDLTSDNASSINIIFVHGLMGHPKKTWQFKVKEPSSGGLRSMFKSKPKPELAPSTPFFWPKHLLAEDLPDARVWTYGYDADALQGIFTAKNKNSISQHGNDLKVKLERTIKGSIIFVAHSLGGVLVKDVLWQSQFCQENTKGIIFLGTPHRGSGLGDYAGVAANLAGMALQDINHKLVRSLEVDNQVLNIINREFIKTITRLRIPIHSFQEGKPISGVKGFHDKVVPDYSSVLDIDPSLETRETINHDHMQMAKCERRTDEQYDAILGVVRQYTSQYISRSITPLADGPPAVRDLSTSNLVPTLSTTNASARQRSSDRMIEPHYLLPYANRQFTGRQKQIEELEDRLLNKDDFQELAVCGLGGIGKTQIALGFCRFVKTYHPQYSIFWISALSRASFERDYAEIARECSIPVPDRKQLLRSVQQFLESDAAGTWIMIIDNADARDLMIDPERGLRMYLPESQKGIRIYTTRDEGLAHDLTLAIKTVVVEEMEYRDAKALLSKYLDESNHLDDETAVTELLEELEFLPLAIVQAASFMTKTYITVPQYLALMRKTDENRVKLLSEESHQAVRPGSSKAIIVTWLISFDRIRDEEPSALNLLYFLSMIQNKDIPHSILPQESEVDLTRALGVLRNYSFLIKRDKANIYDMHRLVHQAVKAWMRGSSDIDWSNDWQIAHLANIWPSAEVKNEPLWQSYLPHAIAAISASVDSPTEQRASLCLLVGRCLRIDGRMMEAVELLIDSYVWRAENLDPNDGTRLESQRELAIAYRWSGHELEAIEVLSQLARKEEALPDGESASRMKTLYELGMSHLWVGNSTEAIATLKDVVANLSVTTTGDNIELMEALHGLVLAYRSNDQPELASELLERHPGIEGKANPDIGQRGLVNSLVPRANTLDRSVNDLLDLIGKLSFIDLNIFRRSDDHELRYVLAKAIWFLSPSQASDLYSVVEIIRRLQRLQDTKSKGKPDTDTSSRPNEASVRLNELLMYLFPKDRDSLLTTRVDQNLLGLHSVIKQAISVMVKVQAISTLILAERYAIREGDAQHHYLTVGRSVWSIIPCPEIMSNSGSTQLLLCSRLVDILWTNIMAARKEIGSQSPLSQMNMLHNQRLTVRVGMDSVLVTRMHVEKSNPQGNRSFIRWKMCMAVEYWQQGYPQEAMLQIQAAQRSLGRRDPDQELSVECQEWICRFESENFSASNSQQATRHLAETWVS